MFARKLVNCALLVAVGIFGTACGPAGNTHVENAVAPVVAEAREQQSIRQKLAEQRAKQIQRLEAYAKAGVFPKNRVSPVMINVFRDEEGHLCAVANLVHLDGLDKVVDETARTNNFVKVAEQKEGPLHDWVLTSGLTREEIAFIQAPYMPVRPQVEFEAEERARLQAHFTKVLEQLRENNDESLNVAVARLADAAPDHAVATGSFATPPGA